MGIGNDTETIYNMAPGDFIPTAYVSARTLHHTTHVLSVSYNDPELFKIVFKSYYKDHEMETIEAISCVEYINGPFWAGFSQKEREDAIGVL